MARSTRLAILFLAVLAAGCGDDGAVASDGTVDTEDPADATGTSGDDPGRMEGCDVLEGFDEYVAGLQKTGDDGYTFTLVSATPAPPQQGDNTWVVDIVDASAAPVADVAGFDVLPWMPDHGHGTNIIADVTPVEGEVGRYEISSIDLWMPGVWTVQVTVENDAGAPVDDATFAFCIEG